MPYTTVDGWVRHHAGSSPERAAIIDGDSILTYRQLAELSEEWATRLRLAGIAPGDLVVLDCGRGANSVVAMMAVLSVGAIFAPLDEGDPLARRDTIVRQSCPAAILTTKPGHSLAATSFDLAVGSPARPRSANGEPKTADPGAYVMFTSGSTGTPKGVLVGHRAIINLVQEPRFGLGPGVRVPHCSNEAFDISTWEIWGALCNGGTLVLLEVSTLLHPASFRSLLNTHRIDVMMLPTAVFNFLADADPSVLTPLKRLFFGGERASASHVSKVLSSAGPGFRLVNDYGPTEATCSAVLADLTEGRYTDDVPIGKPLHNVGGYVLDDRGNHAAEGELYLTGQCLAHGYWRDPRATLERFVEIEVAGETVRAYRTGDTCRIDEGQLYFVGRRDTMVKLRGHRIELSEVEMTLAQVPEVGEVCVLLLDSPQGPQLVAFISARGELSLTRLRQSAQQCLPQYMLPSRMVEVDRMPLNATGKIDRARLAENARAFDGRQPRSRC